VPRRSTRDPLDGDAESMSIDRPEHSCASCGGQFPSAYWFRAPQLCIECFGRLPEPERQRIVAEFPVAPAEIPEEQRPIPDVVDFQISTFTEIWILAGYSLMFWGVSVAVRDLGGALYWVLLVALVAQTIRFAWLYFPSPRRMQKRGDTLALYFRDRRSRTLRLEGLTARGKYWQYGTPWMLEVVDRSGEHQVNIWAIYFSNSEVLRRLVPLAERS
jgi:hypothetical protein